MGPTLHLHHGEGRKLFTADDLEAELDTSRERIVELAHADAASDLAILGGKLADLSPELARRVVGIRSVWRATVLAGNCAAQAISDEYLRLLDEAALELDQAAAAAPPPPKTRRGKAH